MSLRSLVASVSAILAVAIAAQPAPEAALAAYQKCARAASKHANIPAEVIAACLAPAEAGVPGAQYAIAVFLLDRNEAGDRTAGLGWLEKSAATGNPGAAFALAGALLQEDAPSSKARGASFLKSAICADYPHALSALQGTGVTREQIQCGRNPERDFTGEWIANLTWVKAGAVGAETPEYKLKVIVQGDSAQVFMQNDGAWVEVKPGKFKVQVNKQTASVTADDAGWDFDGEWIESWTIQLLRVTSDEARVAYTRTVNNPHLPNTLSWRAFSSFSDGVARRVSK